VDHEGALYIVPNRKRQNDNGKTFVECEMRKYMRWLLRGKGKVALENQMRQLKAAIALSGVFHELEKCLREFLDSEMVKVYLEDPEVGEDDPTRRRIRLFQKAYEEIVAN
jgi:hypothetical protein